MAREDLTEKERAEMLAQIKAEAEQQAKAILSEDDQLKLEQETAARHLSLDAANLEQTGQRLASVDEGAAASLGLESKLQTIRDLLKERLLQRLNTPGYPLDPQNPPYV